MTRIQNLFPSSKGKETVQTQVSAANQSIVKQTPYTLRHLAIIMDGNGRWATKRHLPRLAGHKAGVNALQLKNMLTGQRVKAPETLLQHYPELKKIADPIDDDLASPNLPLLA